MNNTNDLIRRSDAIDAVYSRIKQIGYENNVDVLSIRQAIREVPSAQPDSVFFVKTNQFLSPAEMKKLKENLTSQCENIVLLPEDCDVVFPKRKKAKWISELRPHKTEDEEFVYWYTYCSVCGCQKRPGWFDAKFCPNCGSDLRGDDYV